MNFKIGLEDLPVGRSGKRAFSLRFYELIFGQITQARLESYKPIMSLLSSAGRIHLHFCLGLCLMIPAAVFGQTNYYATNGIEYSVVGSLLGDQVFPDAAVSPNGGFVVWQDNITDGSGSGISARRVDSTLSGTLGTFRVNAKGTNDQENPHVALLKNGGAVFVWQGGAPSYQHIYARFLTSSNTWLTTNDVSVSAFINNFQINPAVAVLNNSNVVVVWASMNQTGSNSLQDVYGQILSPTGQKVGGEFLINQFVSYNQRTPAVAPLKNGGFVVAWVSEQQRSSAPDWGTNSNYYTSSAIALPSVDIYARLYQSSGAAVNNEFLVNSDNNVSANPSVAAATDGTFTITWGQRDARMLDNSWDIYARSFSSDGNGGAAIRVNTHVFGDQYAPSISSLGVDYLVTWTSLGQDGSREGVFGQFMRTGGALIGGEFRVNTTTTSQQKYPVVASDGAQQFLVVWASYTGSPYSFDLFAERYVNVAALLQAMSAPFVYVPFVLSNNVYQPQLQITWPSLLGISVSNFEVYVDGAPTAMGVTTSNQWTMKAVNNLTTNSTHSFQVTYVTTDGRRAPLSPAVNGTTWSGLSWGGIPYEWMAAFFGGYSGGHYTTTYWPAPNSTVEANLTLQQIFLSGGNPLDSSTWLKQQLIKTPQGIFLIWNTQPGATYQVQVTTNFGTWSNLGGPRFAAGTSDSIYVGGSPAGYYRVALLR